MMKVDQLFLNTNNNHRFQSHHQVQTLLPVHENNLQACALIVQCVIMGLK